MPSRWSCCWKFSLFITERLTAATLGRFNRFHAVSSIIIQDLFSLRYFTTAQMASWRLYLHFDLAKEPFLHLLRQLLLLKDFCQLWHLFLLIISVFIVKLRVLVHLRFSFCWVQFAGILSISENRLNFVDNTTKTECGYLWELVLLRSDLTLVFDNLKRCNGLGEQCSRQYFLCHFVKIITFLRMFHKS